jgi:hypothetical protein
MEILMKTFCKLAMFTAMMSILTVWAFGQAPAPQTTLVNITEGQGVISSPGTQAWDGMSELVLIPGASLMGAASTSTVLYLGFTGGSEADVDNMVLYTTPRNGSMITATKKVTLGKLANPSINLTSTSVCPVQPVSATNPCIIALDKISGALSPLDDYYFVIYFTLDTNNEKLFGVGQSVAPGALSGWSLYGDQTRIGKDGALPAGNSGASPSFLLYAANE